MLASLFTLLFSPCPLGHVYIFSPLGPSVILQLSLSVTSETLNFLAESWVGNINIKGEIVSELMW